MTLTFNTSQNFNIYFYLAQRYQVGHVTVVAVAAVVVVQLSEVSSVAFYSQHSSGKRNS